MFIFIVGMVLASLPVHIIIQSIITVRLYYGRRNSLQPFTATLRPTFCNSNKIYYANV